MTQSPPKLVSLLVYNELSPDYFSQEFGSAFRFKMANSISDAKCYLHTSVPELFLISTNRWSEEIAELFRTALSLGITSVVQTESLPTSFLDTLLEKGLSDYIHQPVKPESLSQILHKAVKKTVFTKDLLKSHKHLNIVGELSQTGAWSLEMPSGEVTWTEEVYKIHEFDRDADIRNGDLILKNYLPEDRSRIIEALENAFEKFLPYDIEARIRRNSGEIIWVRTSCIPEVVEGKLIRLKGTVQDITKEKTQQKELHIRANMLDSVSDAIIATDEDGKVTYWNKASERLFEHQRSEVIGKDIKSTSLPWKIFEGEVQDDNSKHEIEIIKPEGAIFLEVKEYPLVIGSEESRAHLSICRDRTTEVNARRERTSSEQKYRSLFNHLSEGLILIDGKGTVIEINPAAEIILEVDQDKRQRSSIFKLFKKISNENGKPIQLKNRREFIRLFSSGQRFSEMEFAFERQSGHLEWLTLSGFAIPSGINGDNLFAIIIRSVTEKRKADEALMRSNQTLTMAQNMAKLGYWFWNPCSSSMTWSFQMQYIFGIEPGHEPADIESFSLLISEDDRDVFVRDFKALTKIGKSIDTSYFIKNQRDGVERYVHLRGEVLETENGISKEVFGTVWDVTEIRQQEKALVASEEKFRNLFESSPVAVGLGDPETNTWIDCNTAMEALLGYSSADLRDNENSHSFLPLFSDDKKTMQESLRDGVFGPFEKTLISKSGNSIHVLINGFTIKSCEGKTLVWFHFYDLTQLNEKSQKLKKTEEQLSHLVEQTRDLVLTLTADGVITYSSPNIQSVLGYNPEDVLNRHFSEIVHPDDTEGVSKVIKNMRENPGKHVKHTFRGLTRMGEELWLQSNGVIRKNQEGEYNVVAVVRDIDQEKRNDEKISQLSLVANKTTNAVIITGKDRKIRWVNEGFEKMTGYTAEEVFMESPGSLLQGPRSDKKAIRKMADHIRRELPVHVELINYRKNGEPYWIEIFLNPVFNDDGELTNFIAIENDVTERKLLEEKLILRNHLQQILMGKASSFINLPQNELDRAIDDVLAEIGSFVKVDRAYLFSYSHVRQTASCTNEWCAKGIEPQINYLQEYPFKRMAQILKHHLLGEIFVANDVANIEDDLTRKELEYQDIKSIIAVPIIHSDELYGFVGFDSVRQRKIWSDTEQELLIFLTNLIANTKIRLNYEKDLQKTVSITSAQNDRLQNFAYIVSHNLRSHSSNIYGLVNELKETRDKKEEEMMIDMLGKSSIQLQEALENLNEILKIEKNRDLGLENILVKPVIDECIDHLSKSINSVRAQFEMSIDESLRICFYPPYFESIVYNLLSNTLKYREPSRNLKVSIKAWKEKETTYLSVSDNGKGIDLSIHGSKLFGMYKTFHRHKESRGLGLFMSKKQLEVLGGEIEVESRPGEGATFILKFKEFQNQ